MSPEKIRINGNFVAATVNDLIYFAELSEFYKVKMSQDFMKYHPENLKQFEFPSVEVAHQMSLFYSELTQRRLA